MSSLRPGQDGCEVLDLINDLRDVDGIEQLISLPQIVVVGKQSCGKSSVLHAISGIEFPMDAGLCTQFPTEIVLKRSITTSAKAKIRCPTSQPCDGKHSDFSSKWSNATLEDLNTIINETKIELGLEKTTRIDEHRLVLEISGPEREYLTLIDVPGIIVSADDDSDIGRVDKINDYYIVENKRAIVLAVVTAKDCFENQSILRRIKADAVTRRRTLGIITHPNTVSTGETIEKACLEELEYNRRVYGHGWHALRNTKHGEDKCYRDIVEEKFFRDTAHWKTLSQDRVGSKALRSKLSKILTTTITEALPRIKTQVQGQLRDITAQLESLGEARDTPRELRRFLEKISWTLFRKIEDLMTPSLSIANGQQSLRSKIQQAYKIFSEEMQDKAGLWQVPEGDGGIKEQEELQGIWDMRSPETQFVNLYSMAGFLGREFDNHQRKDLLNTISSAWSSTIFLRQSCRWVKMAKRHSASICDEVELRLFQSVRQSTGDETIARRLISSQLKPALLERKSKLLGKIDELYAPYILGGSPCMSRAYDEKVSGFLTRLIAEKKPSDANFLFGKTQFYYYLVLDTFIENFIQLGVENCLLKDLREILTISDLDDAEVEQLANELPEIKHRRAILQSEEDSYSKALGLISEKSVNSTFWETVAKIDTHGRQGYGVQPSVTTTQIFVSPATPIEAFIPSITSQMKNLSSSNASSRSSSPRSHRSSRSLSSATSYESKTLKSRRC